MSSQNQRRNILPKIRNLRIAHLEQKVQEVIGSHNTLSEKHNTVCQVVDNHSVALAVLKDKGIITDDEFKAKLDELKKDSTPDPVQPEDG